MPSKKHSWMSLGLLLLLGSMLPAGEIHWRDDYQAARKEALEKNLPLLIDFHTDSCFWCKQMDMRTFQDTQVQEKLTSQWVTLKVHAKQNSALTAALKIRSFPTMVFAGPEGNILGFLEGFMEAPVLIEQLESFRATAITPEWMVADYQEASKAIAKDEYSKALLILKKISQDGKSRPIQTKSNNLILDLERQATDRYTKGKKLLDEGSRAEAAEILQDLVRTFDGTDASKEGRQLLASIGTKKDISETRVSTAAPEILNLIREDFQLGNLASCLERSDMLNVLAPGSNEAREGTVLANQIRDNPESMRIVIEQNSEKLGQMYLGFAEAWVRKGQPQQAIFYLEKTIQAFPGSKQAEMAQILLARLTGPMVRSTDSKK
ncbi:MAG: hypothetical protein RIR17_1391 [Planctomycetota bacterium]